MKLKQLLCIFLLFAMVYITTACGEIKTNTLIDTASLQVVQTGNKTTVFDLASNNKYYFKTTRTRRKNGIAEPIKAVSTNTLDIEILPKGTLKISEKSTNKVYYITFN